MWTKYTYICMWLYVHIQTCIYHIYTSSILNLLRYFLVLKRFSHLEKYFNILFCSSYYQNLTHEPLKYCFQLFKTFGFSRLGLPYYKIYWRLIIIRTCGRQLSQGTSYCWLYVQATIGQIVQLEAHSLVHNNRSLSDTARLRKG